MHTHEELPGRKSAAKSPASRQSAVAPQAAVHAPSSPGAMIALQRSIGNQNANLVQRLTAPPEQHVHSAGCGHGQAPAKTAPAQGDFTPEGQNAALKAATSGPAQPLSGSEKSKATKFFGGFDFSPARVYSGGQHVSRALSAFGAKALTYGNKIVVSTAARMDPRTWFHELRHVKENLSGSKETGRDNGAGTPVTDPNQNSERSASADGDAAAKGAPVAPSVVARQALEKEAA